MDATTYLQMQEEAQASIDSLNNQISILTKQKSDLINANNTAIANTKAECSGILADANDQSAHIIENAKASAAMITEIANKQKLEADSYVASQKSIADNRISDVKKLEDALGIKQAKLDQDEKDFNIAKEETISGFVSHAQKAKDFIDESLTYINGIGK